MSELKTYTFWQLAQEYKIEIPIVQRDYAQGRDEPKANEVRDKFLEDLLSALKGTTSIELDFVYGKVKDNVFIPIDGQQRLTTLFLLHWYIAVKVEKPFDKIDFSYKTRISAREFCKELIKNVNVFSIKDTLVISDEIKNASWFFISWKRDPSVKAMLKMLDAIHDKFKKQDCDAIWQKLITPNYLLPNDNPKLNDLIQVIDNSNYAELKEKLDIVRQKPSISFKFLNLEAFQLTDELYLKMNARGKHLSDFENFKAWLIGYVEDLIKKNKEKVNTFEGKWCNQGLNNWQNKIDGVWTDLFWPFKENYLIDKQFMRFFVEMGLFEYAKTEIKKEDGDFLQNIQNLAFTKEKKIDFYTTTYFEKLNCFNATSLDFIFKTLTALMGNDNKLRSLGNLEPYFNLEEVFKALINNSKDYTYPKRVYFYAFISYIIDDKTVNNNEKLFDWMRVTRNLIENTPIDTSTSFANAIKAIVLLQEFKDDILHNLREGNCDKIPFFGTQIKEEKIKADLILRDNDWRNPILEAENHVFLNGKIALLLHDNSDLQKFKNRQEVITNLFINTDIIGKDTNLLGRVLMLSKSLNLEKSLWLGSKHYNSWKEQKFLKDAYYFEAILAMIDRLLNMPCKDYETLLNECLQIENVENLPFWKQVLIKNPILFKSYSLYGGIKRYGNGIFIFERENFSEKTNAILIKNNRNEIITRFCDSGFKLINPSCKKHDYFYSGYKIILQKDDLELIFDVDTIKINGEASQIELLKTDFQTYFAHSVENSPNEFFIDTPSV